jgi:hypothetical protein
MKLTFNRKLLLSPRKNFPVCPKERNEKRIKYAARRRRWEEPGSQQKKGGETERYRWLSLLAQTEEPTRRKRRKTFIYFF